MTDEIAKERKDSEILLDIEKKVNDILNHIKVVDFNVKMLHNKMREGFVKPEPSQDKIVIKEPIIEKPKSEEPKPILPVSISTVSVPTVESFIQVGDSKTEVIKSNKVDGKKHVVSQKIFYASDSKNTILATVKAFDETNNMVGETKTGMTGIWTLSLRPGIYMIQLTKAGTKTPPRPVIDLKYNISIEDNDKKLEDLKI